MNENSAGFTLNFGYVVDLLVKQWGKFLGMWLVGSVAGTMYSMQLPNLYQSTGVLIASQPSTNANANSLGGYSSLASLAGLSLDSGSLTPERLAISTLLSRAFILEFIEKHKLEPDIIASIGWDQETNQIIYDPSLYDEDTGLWLGGKSANDKISPRDQDLYDAFLSKISVRSDDETGLVYLSARDYKPQRAQNLIELLVSDLNKKLRRKDIEKARTSIKFLQIEIEENPYADFEVMLFQLVQNHMQTIVLAETQPDYIFTWLDPPFVPEKKFGPSRAAISMAISVLCLLVILSVIFIIDLIQVFKRRTAGS